MGMETLPDELVKGFLSPLYKKGSPLEASNYRPVTLLSQVLKVMNKMILIRLRTALDPYLLPMQAAYREHRSTLHNMLALNHLIHRSVKAHNHPLYGVFCDFSKCFDSVHRTRLEKVLRAYAVPANIVSFIMRSMDQQKLAVRFAGGVPSDFVINPRFGVMQGCTLAPFLFVIVMDAILRCLDVSDGLPYAHQKRIAGMAYADDVFLLSDTAQGVQRLLNTFTAKAKEFGFHLNPGKGKTEPMHFGDATDTPIYLGDVHIPYAKEYRYLGGIVNPEADWKSDFSKRKKQAWYLMRRFQDVSSLQELCGCYNIGWTWITCFIELDKLPRHPRPTSQLTRK